jgi:hypothetical protein
LTRRVPAGGVLAVLVLLAAAPPGPVRAEPYLAMRTGMDCAACHVNGTGAGMRTAFGVNYSQSILPRRIQRTNGVRTVFDPGFTSGVAVGGDLRVVNRTVMEPGEDTNVFEFGEGNLYAQVKLVPDFLTFYLDEAVAPGGAGSREAFVLLQDTRRQLFLKAGRMLLPFGWRLWDDDAFIRRNTGFNFAAQDVGVELAWRPGRTSVALSVTNGTGGAQENNREKEIALVASRMFARFRVGGSFATNDAPSARRNVGGVFGGVLAGPLTVLGELDVIDDRFDGGIETNHGNERLAFVEANVQITNGVSVKLAYDWDDPYTDIAEDEREMFRIGVEPFLTQFLQVRAFFRYRRAPPQLQEDNANWLTTELHAFF